MSTLQLFRLIEDVNLFNGREANLYTFLAQERRPGGEVRAQDADERGVIGARAACKRLCCGESGRDILRFARS
jgi:hypothetical protein